MTNIFTISCSCNLIEACGKQEVTASGIFRPAKSLKSADLFACNVSGDPPDSWYLASLPSVEQKTR